MADDQPLQTFIDELLKEKHGPTIDPEALESMKADLMPRLEKWIAMKTMEALAQKSPQDLQDFQLLTQKNAANEEVQSFVASRLPDYSSIVTQMLLDFRGVYLGAS